MLPFEKEFWPFKSALFLRLNFRIGPSYQNLSKTLVMSKSTPLNLRSLSIDWFISWEIGESWFMQKTPSQIPNWFDDSKLFLFKNLCSSLNESRSNILLQIESKDAGRQFLMHCLSLFLWVGTTFTFFHSTGNFIWLKDYLKILNHIMTVNFIGQDYLLHLLCCRLIFAHYLKFFQQETVHLSVAHSYSLVVNILCKKFIINFSFLSKFNKEFIISIYRGNTKTFLLVRYVFHIGQYALELVV